MQRDKQVREVKQGKHTQSGTNVYAIHFSGGGDVKLKNTVGAGPEGAASWDHVAAELSGTA